MDWSCTRGGIEGDNHLDYDSRSWETASKSLGSVSVTDYRVGIGLERHGGGPSPDIRLVPGDLRPLSTEYRPGAGLACGTTVLIESSLVASWTPRSKRLAVPAAWSGGFDRSCTDHRLN